MRSRSGARGCPRALAACRGGRLRDSGGGPCGPLPLPRTLSGARRPGMRFIGSSGPLPVPLRKRVSLAPSAPLTPLREHRGEMGGEIRAKSWVWAFQPPSGRSPPRLRAEARLRGPSLGPCAQAKSSREHDPPDLRCRLSRHLPVRRSRRLLAGTASPGVCPKIAPPSFQPPESTPGTPLRMSLRNVPATARSRSVLVVSHHLDGLLLRMPARVLQRAPDPGVHPVSAPGPQVALLDRLLLGMPSLPSEAFPPLAAALSPSSPSRERELDSGSTAGERHPRVAARITALLAPSPFPSRFRTHRHGHPRVCVQSSSVGSRGLPPRPGPLRHRQLPADAARCSPGLARITASPFPRTGSAPKCPRERQRPPLPAP